MPITARDRTEDGQLVGWDSDQKKWIALDEEAEQGSFLGNVGRAAAREFRSVGQGAQDLLVAPDELQQLQEQQLRQEQDAAHQAAPWASAIGSMAPDVAAGVATAPFTGGMSIPAMLATEAGAGALTGALRPGSIEARMGAAALGATGAVGGVALGHVAAAGVGGALKIFGQLEGRTLGLIGRQVDQAGERVRIARQPIEGEVMPPQRGVGAAETPEGMINRPPVEEAESQLLRETEQAGAERASPGFDAKLERANQLGWVSPIGQGTRAGSTARMGQAAREYLPFGDIAEQRVKAGNQALLVRQAAKALGEPDYQKVTRLDDVLPFAEARIGRDFQEIQSRLPSIDAAEIKNALSGLHQTEGIFGKMQGEKQIAQGIENLENRIGDVTGAEFMSSRRWLSARMAQFYREGMTDDADILRNAIHKMDDVLERELKANKYKTGLAEKWSTARQQWQLLSMMEHGASTSTTGDVNPISLLKQMRKPPSSGGFGRSGPADTKSAASELFDLLHVAADAETGIPHTGVRQLLMKQGAKGLVGALGIGGAANAVGSLWGD